MSLANPLWGAPGIHGELLKLGIDVGQTTVAVDEDVTVDGVAVTDDASVDLAGGRYICGFYRCVARICLLENEG
jgi:hypothetical protein